ncbi:MAG: PDZ domain-containing protein [Polaribacter sp.]
MENEFQYDLKDLTREEKLKYNSYKTSIEGIGSMKTETAQIIKMDNGVVLYVNYLKEQKEEIIKSLESFPSSRGYEIETLSKQNNVIEYLVKKKYGKVIGFLKFYVSKENLWGFHALIPYKLEKFEVDIKNVLNHAKDGFVHLKKTYIKNEAGVAIYAVDKTYNYITNSYYSNVEDKKFKILFLDYKMGHFEALKYQIKKMNLSLPNFKRVQYKNEENLFGYQFISNNNEIQILISAKDGHLEPTISFYFRENKNTPKKRKDVSTKLINNAGNKLAKTLTYYKQISKQLEQIANEKNTIKVGRLKDIVRPTLKMANTLDVNQNAILKDIQIIKKVLVQTDCIEAKKEIEAALTLMNGLINNINNYKKEVSLCLSKTGNTALSHFKVAYKSFEASFKELFPTAKRIDNVYTAPCFYAGEIDLKETKTNEKTHNNNVKTTKKLPTKYYDVGLTVDNDKSVKHIKVVHVKPGSPADKANIKEGDIVIKVGNQLMAKLFGKWAQGYFKNKVEGKKIRMEVYSKKNDKVRTLLVETGPNGNFQLIKEEPFKATFKKIEYSDNSVYEGLTKFGVPHGNGNMIWKDQKKSYKGNFENGKCHGNGVYIMSETESYEGTFKNGSMTGKGKRFYRDGSSYEGEIYKGVPYGQGTYIFPNGNRYRGKFVDKKREGVFYCIIDGKKYVLEYENDKVVSKKLLE